MRGFLLSGRWPSGRTVAAAIILAIAVHAAVYKDLWDFGVFRSAAARTLAGESAYVSGAPNPYKYAPVVAVLYAPFTLLPERPAAVLWVLLSAGLLFAFLLRSAEAFGAKGHGYVALCCVPFMKNMFALGQCEALLLYLAAEAERLGARRPWLAGVLGGAACLFKPTFAIFLAVAIWRRQFTRALALVATVLVGLALPILWQGPARAWAELLRWRALIDATQAMFCDFDNHSVFGATCRYFAAPPSIAFLAIAVGLGALVVAALAAPFLRARSWPSGELVAAIGFYLTAALSPHGWRFTLLGLAPLLFALFAQSERLGRRARFLVLAIPLIPALYGAIAFEVLGWELFQRIVDLKFYGLFGFASAFAAVATFCVALRRGRPEDPVPAWKLRSTGRG